MASEVLVTIYEADLHKGACSSAGWGSNTSHYRRIQEFDQAFIIK